MDSSESGLYCLPLGTTILNWWTDGPAKKIVKQICDKDKPIDIAIDE